MPTLIKKISAKYGADHKMTEAEAEAKLTEMLAGCKKATHGTTVSAV